MIKDSLSPSAKLIDALNIIDLSTKRLAVVIDHETRVIGTLTDGDIRRSLLSGNDLNTCVVEAMNKQPILKKVECQIEHFKRY